MLSLREQEWKRERLVTDLMFHFRLKREEAQAVLWAEEERKKALLQAGFRALLEREEKHGRKEMRELFGVSPLPEGAGK